MDSIPLKDKIQAIEAELEKVIPEKISAGWAQVQSGLELRSIPPVLWQQISEPGRDLLKRGGKRWRPLLMLLCAEMYGDWHLALPLTPMVEIAHNGSLIIDDIEDAAQQRRGGAAQHIKFGMDLALNAGNLMYFFPARVIDTASFSDEQFELFLESLFRDIAPGDRFILGFGDNVPTDASFKRVKRIARFWAERGSYPLPVS